MKLKREILSIVLAIFLLISFVSAQDISDIRESAEGVQEKIDEVKSFGDEERWEYLSQKWQEALLKNKYVSYADNLFKKGNIAFLIILGQEYSLSFTFFMVIIVWIFIFFALSSLIGNVSSFSNHVNSLFALGMTVISAQIGIFRSISNFIFKVMFYKEGIWPWVSSVLIIILFVILGRLSSLLGKKLKIMKEARKKLQEEADRNTLNIAAEGVRKASKPKSALNNLVPSGDGSTYDLK